MLLKRKGWTMKSYDEMSRSILRRRDEYLEGRKKKTRSILKAAACASVSALVVIAAVVFVKNGIAGGPKIPVATETDISAVSGPESSGRIPPDWDRRAFIAGGKDKDKIIRTDEEHMAHATHILDAVYLGTYTTEYGTELMFLPTKVYRGELSEKNKMTIYVQPYGDMDEQVITSEGTQEGEQPAYEKGQTYLLVLEKHISVYYEHDKFVISGGLYVAANDRDKWIEYHDKVDALSAESVPTEIMYGEPWTESDNLDDVLLASDHIFIVNIDCELDKNPYGPTTLYYCRVKQVLRQTSDIPEHIYVQLFNGTVRIGEDYVLLLSDVGKTNPVFSLSSRCHSVYSVGEAQSIPVLQALFTDWYSK